MKDTLITLQEIQSIEQKNISKDSLRSDSIR